MNAVRKTPVAAAFALSAALSAGLAWQARAADDAKKPADAPAAAATEKPTAAAPAKPADAAKANGTVSGTVLGVDGKPAAAGVKIRLLTPENAKPRKQADATAAAKPGKVPAVAETE